MYVTIDGYLIKTFHLFINYNCVGLLILRCLVNQLINYLFLMVMKCALSFLGAWILCRSVEHRIEGSLCKCFAKNPEPSSINKTIGKPSTI